MPGGVQCPISSSLGEFSTFPAIGIGSGILGFRPYWCPSPFPSLSILGVFHSLLSAIGFQSCFFYKGRRIATHSVDPLLTHSLGEFRAWDWLWYPMLWSQRRNM